MQELYRLMDDSRNGDLVARGMRLKNHHHRKLFEHDFRKKKYGSSPGCASGSSGRQAGPRTCR